MVTSYSIPMLLKPTSSFLGSPSTDSSICSTSSRLNIPLRTFSRKLKPPNSLSFRFYKESPAKIVAFSSMGGSQVIEDGSTEQFLQNNSIGDFMRFKRGSDGSSGELQTAVVSYKNRLPWYLFNPSLQVDLVSTVHIADKEYFTTLQKELDAYDCVLYEMVASRESLEKKRKKFMAVKRSKGSHSEGFNIIGFMQRQMALILMLDFQLDCLGYEGENWYHADLDYETFQQLQLEKGENFFTFARDMTIKSAKAMIEPSPVPEEDLGPWKSKLLWASRVFPMPLVGLYIIESVCNLASYSSEYPELEALSRLEFDAALKVFLAKLLTSEFTQVTDSIESDSVIIGERNKAASEALKRAVEEGHNRIAILYGCGHMPDMGRRLREEFDLIPTQVRWITAWSIKNRVPDDSSLPFLRKLAKVSGWPLNRYQTLALLIFFVVLALDLWFWGVIFGSTVDFLTYIASQLGGRILPI